MVYDSANKQVVLFGGNDYYPVPLTETWVWSGSNWTQKFPRTSPPALGGYFGTSYDSVHGQVVLFEGGGQYQAPETWVWDGSEWTQSLPRTSPSARVGYAIAYDSAHGQVVLFGGAEGTNVLGDTWVWDGSNWTQKFPQASPPAQAYSALVYDSTDERIVLVGTGSCSDIWEWDGSNWAQEFVRTTPARGPFSTVFDSAQSQFVLFGSPMHGIAEMDDTFTWNGVAPTPALPTICGVTSASAFGGLTNDFAVSAPGSWIEIYGSNLAPDTRSWSSADFNGDSAPTSLDGVEATIDGEKAFIEYISPNQVNAQIPSDIQNVAQHYLTVSNGGTVGVPFGISLNVTAPSLFAPASFNIGGDQYVFAELPDGTFVLPVGAIPDFNSRPAKPGETVVMYGIGFGDVTPAISAGQIVTESNQLSGSLQISFGGTVAQLPYFGLAPNFVGLYRFNVVVPTVPDGDLVPLTFNLNGVAGAQTLVTAVHQ